MIEFYNTPTEQEWSVALSNFPESNFLQSWQWGESQTIMGNSIVRIVVYREKRIVGLFGGTLRDARRGRYLEISGGPLIDWSDTELVTSVTTELRHIGQRYGCVFVRVRPQIARHTTELQRYGFRRSPMHLHAENTSIIDLTKSESELLQAMRQQTRQEVRRVEKRNIAISHDSQIESVLGFVKLQTETALRQHFVPEPARVLLAYHEAFKDILRIYKAEHDGTLLNLAIVIMHQNEAVYFEAASTEAARKEPGAYGIIWQIMRDAKAAGIQRLNLWGIAPENATNHRYSGVTTFKRGFGGNDVHYLPAHDLVIKPTRYLVNYTIESIRKKRRKL